MTLPDEFGADEDVDYEPNLAEAEFPAVVPVRIVFSETQNLAAQFASCMTWQISNAQPIQILPRRLHRLEAMIWFPGGFVGQTLFFNTKLDPLTLTNPQGLQVASQMIITFKSQQPLYAVASTVGPTPVCVLDQSFGQAQ